MAKLREACSALVASIAASQDFSYVLLYARHVFRGYPELKAKVAENDAKDQAAILACIAEGIKSGEIRSDIDPVSAASAFMGGIYVTATIWIESGFGFDIRRGLRRSLGRFRADRLRQADGEVARGQGRRQGRAAAYFPLRPPPARSKLASARKARRLPPTRRKPKAASPKAAPKRPAPRPLATKARDKTQAKTRAKKPPEKPGSPSAK